MCDSTPHDLPAEIVYVFFGSHSCWIYRVLFQAISEREFLKVLGVAPVVPLVAKLTYTPPVAESPELTATEVKARWGAYKKEFINGWNQSRLDDWYDKYINPPIIITNDGFARAVVKYPPDYPILLRKT